MTVVKTIVKDRVFQIAAIVAILSLFLARPRLADINFTTLWSLLGMMTIIQIFEYLHVLDYLAYRLTAGAHTARQLTWFFVMLSFVAAMFLTNDMSVLTFMPLYLRVAKKLDLPQIVPATAIAMAANLGSFMTPFGNPHNIFLMSKFKISLLDFGMWIIPLFVIAVIFLAAMMLFIKPKEVPVVPVQDLRVNTRLTTITCLVALLVFISVFGVIPPWVAAVITVLYAAVLDIKILAHVDYGIIFTFTAFFIIVSDIQQVPAVVAVLSALEKSPTSVYFTSIATSQVMSNVPATVLVANFTNHVAALFYGTNIGGLGTMIASLCNLLAFKQFSLHASKDVRKKFFVPFAVMNFIGLAVIGGVCYLAVLYFS
ncbi:SLC13 family permease [Lacticaseibacillus sharpeae]|uniref:Di-and tricarboxylate transporter n=1 Tax=Lacticaseibacillus sharpeae JCM 1186 = DSM 20505 TaxID=1291052 RepID=A0A0R1ZHU1_9LACO|nr:SLC13 family permease [Lacticaseibacillus sharpeae]KRM54520.1 di-and tricarboxylate transporter [Lacticaseibacillus sharpeae JCM 1186 = DSM 20505]